MRRHGKTATDRRQLVESTIDAVTQSVVRHQNCPCIYTPVLAEAFWEGEPL